MSSLKNALDILDLFLDSKEDLGVSEISLLSGLHKATVSRIVISLASRGYLKQIKKRGKYSLSTKFLDFSGIFKKRNRIRHVAMPFLFEMVQLTKESAILTIWDGQRIYYTEVIQGSYNLRLPAVETSEIPLHCTGLGKVYLASMTEQELENYFNTQKLKAYTPCTITDIDSLKASLKTMAKEGVAFDYDEFQPGISNVSAGIKDDEGITVASIGILGHIFRLNRDKMKDVVPYVRNCAMAISRDLGYKGR